MNAPATAFLPDDSTLERAAEWYALFQAGPVSEADRERWAAWMASDQAAPAAWARVESISRRFALPVPLRQAADSALSLSNRRLHDRRRALQLLGLMGATGLGAWTAAQTPPIARQLIALRADHHSGIGQTRELTLTDGSRVFLNADSALDVQFDHELRALRLLRGEVLVQTARDALPTARPFVVDTAQGHMRALGTRFSVRLDDDGRTRLGVFEGKVAVRTTDSPQIETVIDTGQRVRFDSHAIEPARAADPAREAWTRGLLLAQDQPLSVFIKELSLHRRGLLTCDTAVVHLRVVGGFPLHDTDRALAMLEAALPVQIHQRFPWWTTVRAR